MANKLDICNSALIKLGSRLIVSLGDSTKSARLLNQQYNICKLAVLRSHIWNFAKDRAVLAPLVDTPAFGYAQAYQLPADFVRVAKINGEIRGIQYEVEGDKILTNDNQMELEYIKDVTNEANMDALFVEALAFYLAWEISIPLTGDKELKQQMWEGYKTVLRNAKSVDGQENPAPELLATQYLEARGVGSSAIPATTKFPVGPR
jgi:hypothetical protein